MHRETTASPYRMLSPPRQRRREVKIQTDQQVNIPHVYIYYGEIKRNLSNVVQRDRQRLTHHFLTRIREKVENDFRVDAQHSGDPGKQIVDNGPDQKRPQDARNAFLIKDRDLAAHRKKQCSGNHHEQGDTGTKQGSVDGTPEFYFANIGRYARIKVKRVCAVTTDNGKHGYEADNVQPDNVLRILL